MDSAAEVTQEPSQGDIVQNAENNDEWKNSQNLYSNTQVNPDTVDVITEMNQDTVDVITKANQDNVNMITQVNEDTVDVFTKANQDNVNVVTQVNQDNLDVITQVHVNEDTVDVITKANQDNVNVVTQVNQDNVDVITQVNEDTVDVITEVNQDNVNVITLVNQDSVDVITQVNQDTVDVITQVNQDTVDLITQVNQDTVDVTMRKADEVHSGGGSESIKNVTNQSETVEVKCESGNNTVTHVEHSVKQECVDTIREEPSGFVQCETDVAVSEMDSDVPSLTVEIKTEKAEQLSSCIAGHQGGNMEINVATIKTEIVDGSKSRVSQHMGYRDDETDTDSDSDSSSSSSDDESSGEETYRLWELVWSSGDKSLLKTLREKIRTRGEVYPEELPSLQDLTITVDEAEEMRMVGKISGIVETLVVIQSERETPALNEDTVLFTENRQVLGKIFEVFGPVIMPMYSVRFNSSEDIKSRSVEIGQRVFCAPRKRELTQYVFMHQLEQTKGSDASWRNDREVPYRHLEYSDDEEEKRARARHKAQKRWEERNNRNRQTEQPRVKRRKRPGKSSEKNTHTNGSPAGAGPHQRPPKVRRGRGRFRKIGSPNGETGSKSPATPKSQSSNNPWEAKSSPKQEANDEKQKRTGNKFPHHASNSSPCSPMPGKCRPQRFSGPPQFTGGPNRYPPFPHRFGYPGFGGMNQTRFFPPANFLRFSNQQRFGEHGHPPNFAFPSHLYNMNAFMGLVPFGGTPGPHIMPAYSEGHEVQHTLPNEHSEPTETKKSKPKPIDTRYMQNKAESNS